MTKFAESHGRIYLVDSPPEISDRLAADSYALKIDPAGELYLERIARFSLPDEIYGDIDKMSDRILRSYSDRSGVTGVLLSGEKGSGKTLLGKKVALTLLEQGQPMIAVNIGISGDKFNIFLQKIGQPITLFFDEFEKTYDSQESQNGLLTLLDGVYPIKMLAILTTNDSSRMTAPMIDRPGRIYYKIDYTGLSYSFIMEYAEKNLKDKKHLPELSRLAALVELNFDQLKALIEEMNRYDESVLEAVQYLNVSVKPKFSSMMIASMSRGGVQIPKNEWFSDMFIGELELEPDENSDDLLFHYTVPNSHGMSYQSLERLCHSDDDDNNLMDEIGLDEDDIYIVRSKWGSRLAENYQQTLKALPQVIRFDPMDTKIEVRKNGRIAITNEDGDEVLLERITYSFSKKF